MNEPFWINNSRYLFNEFNFIPCSECSLNKNLNRITRFLIIVSIVVAAVVENIKPLYLGTFIITVIAILYFLSPNQMNKDSFGNISNRPMNSKDYQIPPGYGPLGSLNNQFVMPQYYDAGPGQESLLHKLNNPTYVDYDPGYNLPSPYQYPIDNYGVGPQGVRTTNAVLNTDMNVFMKDPVLRTPTQDNPFMNVMPLDYGAPPIFDDYNRYEKINYPTQESQKIRNEVSNEFEKGLFQNASGLIWQRNNSQREYVSQPVGGEPNRQGEFAEWLYGTGGKQGLVCKTGSIYSRYGLQYTDDSLMCTGFNVSTPSNSGLLDGNLMSSVDQSGSMYE